MKISLNWLKDFIDIQESPEKLGTILTDIGLEVEGLEQIEEVEGGMKGLVVGEVLECSKHPDADKLSLTRVDVGGEEPLSVVCGAPNVAAGQKVVVATIGTELSMNGSSFTIKRAKIRGQLSEGMICAEDEIGLGTSHDGIMVLDNTAVPGTPAADYFKLESDSVFEIGLTPNRIDAASHFGTARDLAAFYSMSRKIELKKPFLTDIKPDSKGRTVEVTIEDTEGCRRFTGLTITDIQVAPSPKWLQLRLKAIGLSPINNVVDITNYVLHELGQPLHAYDADKLADDKIIVRRPAEGTSFVTLDGVERKLSAEDVMVCDAKRGVCIAGVFGGFESGITEQTKNIFLESAYFDPVSVRKTAKRHGLSTDSSFRFERGVDPEITLVALKRAASLIRDLAKGTISSEIIDIHPSPIKAWEIDAKYSHIDRLCGKKIDPSLIKSILASLDIRVVKEEGDDLKLLVAPYRVDVTREADVIEEILRIYGYNNIGFSDKLNSSVSYQQQPDHEKMVNFVSDYLTSNGFTEIMANSLTRGEYYRELTSFPAEKSVPVMNPLSADLNVMRQTILFGGLESISRNINHKNPNLRLFEYGRVYQLENKDTADFKNFREHPVFGIFLSGNREEARWNAAEQKVDFFQLKAYFLSLLAKLGISESRLDVAPLEDRQDIFGGGLAFSLAGDILVEAGTVQPELLARFDIEQEVFFAEIFWDVLFKKITLSRSFTELPKFPEVRRDLALLIDEEIEYAKIEKLAYSAGKGMLKRVLLFDYYRGKNIPEGKKSYAVSFYLQDLKKTLTDKEIDRIMSKLTDLLKAELNATLR
ncbi:MAG: phenylalanine--tRNA ligase subunit beta [Bacteroidales bacterium]|nr:phenylalanine--tRNA ligase subunit beta [Bacteroidales bacterium]